MLRPILRHFEFEYANGYLFWDKAGHVARDLVQALPGLRLNNQLVDQRDFSLPNRAIDLYYGIRMASLRSCGEDGEEFRKLTSLLIEILGEELELEAMTAFRFQFAFGWPCHTGEEAHSLAMKLLPTEVGQMVKPGEFQGAQLEFRRGAIVTTTRYTILELSPPPGPARPDLPGPRVPHVIASVTCNNFDPIPMREFKAIDFLESTENRLSKELLNNIITKTNAAPA